MPVLLHSGRIYTDSLWPPFDECAHQAISSSWDKIRSSLHSLLPSLVHEGRAGGSRHKGTLCSGPFFQWNNSEDDFTLLLVSTFPCKCDGTGVALLLTVFPAVLFRRRPAKSVVPSLQADWRAMEPEMEVFLAGCSRMMPEDGRKSLAGSQRQAFSSWV